MTVVPHSTYAIIKKGGSQMVEFWHQMPSHNSTVQEPTICPITHYIWKVLTLAFMQ